MAQDKNDDDVRRREDETARYRLAAEETLDQLDWCVNYLHRIRKGSIADVIDKNRRLIQRQMSGTGG
jgi:hypothetical protein